jgi:hypothetical protein
MIYAYPTMRRKYGAFVVHSFTELASESLGLEVARLQMGLSCGSLLWPGDLPICSSAILSKLVMRWMT